MSNFERVATFTLSDQIEGGHANDPDDLGGETYKGIARNKHPEWDGWDIIDEMRDEPGFPGILDTNQHLQGLVNRFYRAYYDSFPVIALDDVPYGVALPLFDHFVNGGHKGVTRVVQRALNICGEGLTVDGLWGPRTTTAWKHVYNEDFILVGENLPGSTVLGILLPTAREREYTWLVGRNPNLAKFYRGWLNRNYFCQIEAMEL